MKSMQRMSLSNKMKLPSLKILKYRWRYFLSKFKRTKQQPDHEFIYEKEE